MCETGLDAPKIKQTARANTRAVFYWALCDGSEELD